MNGNQDYMSTETEAAAGSDMYDPYAETASAGQEASYDSNADPEDYFSDAVPYSPSKTMDDRGRRGGGRGRGRDGGRDGGRGGRGRGGGRGGYGGGGDRRGGGPMRSSRGGGRGGGRPEKPAVSTKLYVTSLPDTCRRSDLVKLFEQYGKVVECDIVKHYAFLHFEDPDEAKLAADGLNGHEFQGSTLKVELSISRVRQKPGMGGPNECYKCGKGGHWSKDCPTDRGSRRSRPSYRDDDDEDDDYYARPPPPDPYYRDPYYRDRYPPPPHDRYRPYADPYERRRLPPPPPYDDPYYRDPYVRPPPEVYSRAPLPPPRDPYYDDPYAKSYQPPVADESALTQPPV